VRLTGNVAHDLRTPLQAFQSELELLRDTVKSAAGEVTRQSRVLLRSIKQLDRICNFMNMTINRSIDFTKASSGIKLNPSIESTNMSETLKWAVGCMGASSEKVPIVIASLPKHIHNQIFTDKQWLMENLLCLLSNARKFTTEGEITVRSSLHNAALPSGVVRNNSKLLKQATSLDGSWSESNKPTPTLLIEVEDTGIGISKENRKKLFKPFMQVRMILL
jgi:signal transduction histidine kinase